MVNRRSVQGSTQGFSYNFHWGVGIATGVAALGAGFLLVRHFVWLQSPGLSFAVDVQQYHVTSWLFFSAHNIPIVESAQAMGSGMQGSGVNLLTEITAPAFQFLYLIPPLLLVFGGLLSAASIGGDRSLISPLLNGASISLGYSPGLFAAAFFSSRTVSGFGVSARLGASYSDVLIFGVAYPIAFGAVGGLVYYVARQL